MRHTHIHVLNIVLSLIFVGSAMAGDREWRAGAGGSFYTNTNWNPFFVPGISVVGNLGSNPGDKHATSHGTS